MTRARFTSALELIGGAMFVTGLFLVAPVVALIVGGAGLILVGVLAA